MSKLSPTAIADTIDHIRAQIRCMVGAIDDPPTQRDADAIRERALEFLDGLQECTPLAELWPKAEGIASAECRDHGKCEPLNVNGSLWCPRCLEDPRFEIQGDKIVGPSLKISLEAPINFITLSAVIQDGETKET
jgi:hypothetical protein